jgi:hypothetical protein
VGTLKLREKKRKRFKLPALPASSTWIGCFGLASDEICEREVAAVIAEARRRGHPFRLFDAINEIDERDPDVIPVLCHLGDRTMCAQIVDLFHAPKPIVPIKTIRSLSSGEGAACQGGGATNVSQWFDEAIAIRDRSRS